MSENAPRRSTTVQRRSLAPSGDSPAEAGVKLATNTRDHLLILVPPHDIGTTMQSIMSACLSRRKSILAMAIHGPPGNIPAERQVPATAIAMGNCPSEHILVGIHVPPSGHLHPWTPSLSGLMLGLDACMSKPSRRLIIVMHDDLDLCEDVVERCSVPLTIVATDSGAPSAIWDQNAAGLTLGNRILVGPSQAQDPESIFGLDTAMAIMSVITSGSWRAFRKPEHPGASIARALRIIAAGRQERVDSVAESIARSDTPSDAILADMSQTGFIDITGDADAPEAKITERGIRVATHIPALPDIRSVSIDGALKRIHAWAAWAGAVYDGDHLTGAIATVTADKRNISTTGHSLFQRWSTWVPVADHAVTILRRLYVDPSAVVIPRLVDDSLRWRMAEYRKMWCAQGFHLDPVVSVEEGVFVWLWADGPSLLTIAGAIAAGGYHVAMGRTGLYIADISIPDAKILLQRTRDTLDARIEKRFQDHAVALAIWSSDGATASRSLAIESWRANHISKDGAEVALAACCNAWQRKKRS